MLRAFADPGSGFVVKLLPLSPLTGFHMLLWQHLERVCRRPTRSSRQRYFRMLNEVPTVLLIVIVDHGGGEAIL